MTEVEALEQLTAIFDESALVAAMETEYEPPFAGIHVQMADGSRWVVRVEVAANDSEVNDD